MYKCGYRKVNILVYRPSVARHKRMPRLKLHVLRTSKSVYDYGVKTG